MIIFSTIQNKFICQVSVFALLARNTEHCRFLVLGSSVLKPDFDLRHILIDCEQWFEDKDKDKDEYEDGYDYDDEYDYEDEDDRQKIKAV